MPAQPREVRSTRSRVPVGRRFRLVYVVCTTLFVVAAFGFAVAQVWVVAVACLLMGAAMTGASRQMVARPPDKTPPQE